MNEKLQDKLYDIEVELSSIYNKERTIRPIIAEAIHDMLVEMNPEDASLSFENQDDKPFISYDGGNHAEYASTLATDVGSVRAIFENECKTFEADLMYEEDGYSEDRMSFDDVAMIHDYVVDAYKRFNNGNI